MNFPTGSLKFLAGLAKNNKREWFQPRKEEFEEVVQQPLLELAAMLNAIFEKEAKEYAFLEPKKAVNRIYRDVRFSADKSPYQTHVSVLFPHQKLGKKGGAAFYFGLSAKQATLAAGMYFGETRELQAVRQQLAERHQEFRKILKGKRLKDVFGELQGESLKKAPRQFGADHEAADLLQRKQWLLMAQRPSETVTEKQFGSAVVEAFRAALPFVRFLNEPLLALQGKAAEPLL